MEKEITRKSILIEVLENEKLRRAACSKNARGLEAIRGYEREFAECEKRCWLIADLIHALDSTEVREAMQKWQIRAMTGERMMDDLRLENMPEEPTPITPIVIPMMAIQENTATEREAINYRWDGEKMEAQMAMEI